MHFPGVGAKRKKKRNGYLMPINIYKYQKVKQFKKRVCACIYENTVRAVS